MQHDDPEQDGRHSQVRYRTTLAASTGRCTEGCDCERMYRPAIEMKPMARNVRRAAAEKGRRNERGDLQLMYMPAKQMEPIAKWVGGAAVKPYTGQHMT